MKNTLLMISLILSICFAQTIAQTIGGAGSANDVKAPGLLEVSTFKLTTSPTNEYVLTSDASGNASWQEAVAGGSGFQDQPFVYKGNKIEIVSPYTDKDNLYKGQIHFHTTGSDGADTPTEAVTAYKDAGYDFVSITDHDVVTPDPSVADILFIPGVEEGVTGGHLTWLNATSQIVATDAQTVIDLILLEGGFITMAHPNQVSSHWTDEELEALIGYYGIEVLNAVQPATRNAEDKWDTLLSRYEKVYGTAVDDVHDISSDEFGTGAIQVYANSLSVAEIMENIKRGNFYSTYTPQESTEIELTVSVSKRNITATIAESGTIEFITKDGTISQQEIGTTSTYEVIGNEVYVRILVTSALTKAWSNPIYVNQNIRIDNGGLVKGNLHIADSLYVTGKVGIGTVNSEAALEILSPETISLLINNTKADDTGRQIRIGMNGYDVDEEPSAIIYATVGENTNTIKIGGGTGQMNAATNIKLYTAADNTTTTGDVQMEIMIDGQVKVHGNNVIEGISTGSNVERIISLKIEPGGTPNTNINITATDRFNTPSITNATNLVASGTEGSFSLDATGQNITLDITENVIRRGSAVWQYRHLINSASDELYKIRMTITDGNIVLRLYKHGGTAAISWLSVMDASDEVYFNLTFYTST